MSMRRKLIEVSLPLETINTESAREKSIRHGHPSTLHLWWARRPLAAARAVLFSQLVDDPSSDEDAYRDAAIAEGVPADRINEVVAGLIVAERERLHDLVRRLVVWENINDDTLYKQAHAEILKSTGGDPPPILDPFCGGGTIPLEAQRLGLEAHASDLNPVAVLITKALIEIPPKFAGRPPVFPGAAESGLGGWPKATGLAEDVRRYGHWMRDQAEKRIGHLYPKATVPDGSKATVIAWIWARTVTCPNPACRIQMPLVRSWWLGKKKGKEAFVIPSVEDGQVMFTIGHDPRQAPTKATDGTVGRTGATCINCATPVPLTYIRTEGRAGRLGVKLMATVAEGNRQRIYLAATPDHEHAAHLPRPNDVPDGELPTNPRDFKTPNYGMTTFADLFTNRQVTALTTFSDLVGEARDRAKDDAMVASMREGERLADGGVGAAAYADAIATYLAFAISRMTNKSCSINTWDSSPKMEAVRGLFARQAIPMAWDFAEANPWGRSSGDFTEDLKWVIQALSRVPARQEGLALQADASSLQSPSLIATDPPYYDNIGYSDLSDFFYVWLRRSLRGVFPQLLSTMLVPKAEELVANPYRHGGPDNAEKFFERGFDRVFANVRKSALADFPITVFYAFKQAETETAGTVSTGWQTLLEGMIRSGWAITGTWPMRSELSNRMLASGTNALASSIVLALRPRPDTAGVSTRRGFLIALRAELPSALRELQQGSIAPVDLAQAAIGPGMAVFSRYARVVEADGSSMTVRTALALINHALDEVLSEQEGDFDNDTRFCVKWFTQFGWTTRKSGEADDLSRAVDTSVGGLVRGGIFHARGGEARLLSPADLESEWDPLTDERISIWEATVRIAKCLAEQGGQAAAMLMAGASQRVDIDAVHELAYLLYTICERAGRTQDALLFNGLGTSWTDLATSMRQHTAGPGAQGAFDFTEGDES